MRVVEAEEEGGPCGSRKERSDRDQCTTSFPFSPKSTVHLCSLTPTSLLLPPPSSDCQHLLIQTSCRNLRVARPAGLDHPPTTVHATTTKQTLTPLRLPTQAPPARRPPPHHRPAKPGAPCCAPPTPVCVLPTAIFILVMLG
jgi:hypothetical protein